jgi:hypothetical protein
VAGQNPASPRNKQLAKTGTRGKKRKERERKRAENVAEIEAVTRAGKKAETEAGIGTEKTGTEVETKTGIVGTKAGNAIGSVSVTGTTGTSGGRAAAGQGTGGGGEPCMLNMSIIVLLLTLG